MNNKITKIVLPIAMAFGTIGATGLVVTQASAATSHAVMAKGYAGTVKSVNAAKHHFIFTSGKSNYTVVWSAKTTWVKGKSTSLKAGAKVTVTGTAKGKVIIAKAITF